MLRNVIVHGDEKTNTAPLDPYEIGDTYIESKPNGLSFDLKTDARLKGLAVSNYAVIPDLIHILSEKEVVYEVYNFSCWAKVHLEQSENGKSVLIKNFYNPGFNIGNIYKKLQDIIMDHLVDHLKQYVNRFNAGISVFSKNHFVNWTNSLLSKLDSWSVLSLILN